MEISSQSLISAIEAAKTAIQVNSNNLANAKTAGYKTQYTDFIDGVYKTNIRAGSKIAGEDMSSPVGLSVGTGSRAIGGYRNMSIGDPIKTDNPLSMAINGNSGYFQVVTSNGNLAYTRNGNFSVNKDRKISLGSGVLLDSDIVIDEGINIDSIEINKDGFITGRSGNNIEEVQIGRVKLYKFPNEQGLEPADKSLLTKSDASGDAIEFYPGENGMPTILSGYIEGSNVDQYREMASLMENLHLMQICSDASNSAKKTFRDMASKLGDS